MLDLLGPLDWPILWFLHQIPPVQVVLISSSAAWFGVLDARTGETVALCNFQGIFKLFAFIPLVCRKPVGFCPVLLKRESGKVEKRIFISGFCRRTISCDPFCKARNQSEQTQALMRKVQKFSARHQIITVEPCWTYAATSCTQSIHACQWEEKWGSDIYALLHWHQPCLIHPSP